MQYVEDGLEMGQCKSKANQRADDKNIDETVQSTRFTFKGGDLRAVERRPTSFADVPWTGRREVLPNFPPDVHEAGGEEKTPDNEHDLADDHGEDVVREERYEEIGEENVPEAECDDGEEN